MRDHVKWLRDFARENTQGDVISAATALELAAEIERLRKIETAARTLSMQMRDDIFDRDMHNLNKISQG